MTKKPLVFATRNVNKIREVAALLGDGMNIDGLDDIGCFIDIPETSPTIEGNAIQKAQYIIDNFQLDCFAEDTGLEIEALNGEPGVYTARYAGLPKNNEANMNLALQKLEGQSNRTAQFKTVVALMLDGKTYTFTGIAKGQIAKERLNGPHGFGYDPIFIPDGYDRSFAQMTSAEKNLISHRGKAIRQFQDFLKNYSENLVNQLEK